MLILFVLHLFAFVPQGSPICMSRHIPLIYSNTQERIIFENPITLHSGGSARVLAVNLLLKHIFEEQFDMSINFYPPVPDLNVTKNFTWYGNPSKHDIHEWFTDGTIHAGGYFNSWTLDAPNTTALADQVQVMPSLTGMVEQQGWFITSNTNKGNNSFATDYRNLIQNTTLQTEAKQSERYPNNSIIHSVASSDVPGNRMIDFHGLDEQGWRLQEYSSEWAMLARIKQLQEDGKDIVMLAWRPSIFSASLDISLINFPNNPSGLRTDPCVSKGICGLPPDSIVSAYANSLESYDQTVFKVFQEFFSRFYIDRIGLQGILVDYARNQNLDMAVCRWLRENEDIWVPWIVSSDAYGIKTNTEQTLKNFTSKGELMAIIATSIFGAALLVGLGFVWRIRDTDLGHVMNPKLTSIWIFGMLVLIVSPLAMVQEQNPTTCALSIGSLSFGISFMLLVPALKAKRLSVIFSDNLNRRMSPYEIYRWLALAAMWEIGLIIIYYFKIESVGLKRSEINEAEYEMSCHANETQAWLYLLGTVKVFYWAGLVYYAWQTKSTWKSYNESKFLSFLSLLCAVILAFNLVIGQMDDLTAYIWRLMTMLMIYTGISVIVLTYGASLFLKREHALQRSKSCRDDKKEDVAAIMRIIRELDKEGRDLLRDSLARHRDFQRKMTKNKNPSILMTELESNRGSVNLDPDEIPTGTLESNVSGGGATEDSVERKRDAADSHEVWADEDAFYDPGENPISPSLIYSSSLLPDSKRSPVDSTVLGSHV